MPSSLQDDGKPNRPERLHRLAGRIGAFTLLELLICMSVIAALLGLSTMGTDLIRGRRLDQASGQVTMVFDYARAQALYRNSPTAVVILTGAGSEADGRALALFEYQPGTGWQQVQNWEILQEGVCFGMDQIPAGAGLSDGLPFETPQISFNGKAVSTGEYLSVVFLPGRGLLMDESVNALRFDLIEGEMANGKMQRRGRSPEFYRVSLLQVTGRYKLERLEL